MTTDARSVHVIICGRVQGVGYRAWCRREAKSLGLSGWVRNCATGEVEAVFCGPPDRVDLMLDACRRGPDWARVDEVRIVSQAAPVSGLFEVRKSL